MQGTLLTCNVKGLSVKFQCRNFSLFLDLRVIRIIFSGLCRDALGKLATHDVLKTTHFDENGAYFYFFSTVQQCFVKRRLFCLPSTVQQCFGPTAP